MTVKMYNNKSTNKTVSKDIELVESTDCILYDTTSILSPVIKLKHIPNANYVYIPYLNRYYYITDIVTANQCCYVSCKCDVLMTYKDNIYNTSQLIARSETLRDNMLVDTSFNMSTDNTIYTRSFGDVIITNHFTYILGVI